MKWFAALFAAKEIHEMTTITTRSSSCHGCKLLSELNVEKSGTVMNCDQNGNGWRYQGYSGGRKQPSRMCVDKGAEPSVKVNEPKEGNSGRVNVPLSTIKLPV